MTAATPLTISAVDTAAGTYASSSTLTLDYSAGDGTGAGAVTAVDNVGNSSSASVQFTVGP